MHIGCKKLVCVFCLLLVGILSFVFGAGEVYGDISGSASVNIHKEDALAITLSGDVTNGSASVNINVDNLNGVFNETGDITATVISTVANGYTLGMDSSTSALTSSGSEATIDELAESAEGYERASFPVNKWGYSLKTGNEYGNYFGMGDGVELQDVSEPTAGTVSTLRLGTKVDSTIPDGRYSTTIVFTLTAKPESRLYMQDVASWKNTLAINESVIAYDLRDGKDYWVTRLETDPAIPDERADCTGEGANRVCTQVWMTQNLDLELESNTKTFTHYDTDLGYTTNDANAVWTPQVATSSNIGDFTDEYGAERSYDSGEIYIYTSNSTSDDSIYTLAQCLEQGNTEYDCEHYHAGNLYNFYTVTALSATSNDNPITVSNANYSSMPNSICPAGWRLPTGATAADGYSDFDYLLYKNSVTADHGISTNVGYAIHLYGDENTNTTGFNNLRSQPLWFTRAGGANGGSLYNQTSYGNYWSSTVYSDPGAYVLDYYSGGIGLANAYHRYNGFSVRCVARAATEPEPQLTAMQDITSATCPTEPTTVVDSRDGEEYTIQQLADGNCWLLDNLRLDLTDPDVQDNLTADTTNASNATLDYLMNGGGTTSDQYATAGVSTNWNNTYSYSAPLIYTAGKNTTGTGGYMAGEYGVYYNYCAASAGSYCYGDGTSAGTSSGDATEDICPAGWRMPTGDSSGEYKALYTAYSSDYTSFVNALHTPLSGGFSNGSAHNQGSLGRFWSSTRSDNNGMYLLDVSTSNVYPRDGEYRFRGLSVRCILK